MVFSEWGLPVRRGHQRFSPNPPQGVFSSPLSGRYTHSRILLTNLLISLCSSCSSFWSFVYVMRWYVLSCLSHGVGVFVRCRGSILWGASEAHFPDLRARQPPPLPSGGFSPCESERTPGQNLFYRSSCAYLTCRGSALYCLSFGTWPLVLSPILTSMLCPYFRSQAA